MSKTHEIERAQWNKYLSEVSRKEIRQPVHIEFEGEDVGDELLTRQLPLLGISAELKGSDARAVDVLVGREGDQGTFTHRVQDAQRILVKESDGGDVECLDIEDSDNQKTLIYFD